jgi:hypothetical protein
VGVRIIGASENTEMIISGRLAIQAEVWGEKVNGTRGAYVEEMRGGV